MSVPFLKKDKSGIRLLFSKALYSREALARLESDLADPSITVASKGRYFELKVQDRTEEDGLEILQRFFYFVRHGG